MWPFTCDWLSMSRIVHDMPILSKGTSLCGIELADSVLNNWTNLLGGKWVVIYTVCPRSSDSFYVVFCYNNRSLLLGHIVQNYTIRNERHIFIWLYNKKSFNHALLSVKKIASDWVMHYTMCQEVVSHFI